MCLDFITESAEAMPPAMVAYKVVVRFGKNGRYAPYCFYGVGAVPVGQGWAMPDNADSYAYLKGVHAYADFEDAHGVYKYVHAEDDETTIVRVLLRGPICRGCHGGCDVVVYREMTIIEEVKPEEQI